MVAAVVGAAVALTLVAGEAEAAKRRRAARSAGPPFAALVVDAKTGNVLYSVNPDASRHPASITKVMTLYLLFEQLERGKISLSTPLTVSAHAAAQSPSKLGLRPGETITVEDAIRAVVTKSANDVAVVIAENLGGSEEAFAAMMTRKARALGMSRTVYRNASGLPNAGQITSARDLVVLGRAIQDRFPKYYRYFSTRAYSYKGRVMANHNRLLGRVAGVDGIKTGYVNASGFNLLTSVRLNDRHIVAVVLGGRSAASRDATMRDLIATYLPKAKPGSRSAPIVAEKGDDAEAAGADKVELARAETKGAETDVEARDEVPVPRTRSIAAAADAPLPADAPIPTTRVTTVRVTGSGLKPAVVAGTARRDAAVVNDATKLAMASASGTTPIATRSIATTTTVAAATTTTPAMRWVTGPSPATTGSADPAARSAFADPATEKAAAADPVAETEVARAETGGEVEEAGSTDAVVPTPRVGWIIQIGATPELARAEELLRSANAKAGHVLGKAEAYTEPVSKDGATLYRARFAGFTERTAQAACQTLKRNAFPCIAIKN